MKLFRDLEAVERDAAGALDRAAGRPLFERLDWFRLIETHRPPPGELLVIRARGENGRAWLFLKVKGRRATGLANWYSLDFGPIVEHPAGLGRERLIRALAEGLRQAGVTALDLAPLRQADALTLPAWLARVRPTTVNWRIDTAGQNFDAYWSARPSRLRHTAARKARAAALDVHIHTSFSAPAWADYERVYAASWKPEEGSPALLRALAEQEGAAGTLRLGLAYKDGAPLAAHFWLTENGVATIHKLAYAEAAKASSPGTVLAMAMFRHALDVDRVRAIDFGLGDDPYKADWMNERRPVYRVAAYDVRTLPGLWQAGRAAAHALVRPLRRD